MATLTSPGVNVSVIDESFYVPSDAGKVTFLLNIELNLDVKLSSSYINK